MWELGERFWVIVRTLPAADWRLRLVARTWSEASFRRSNRDREAYAEIEQRAVSPLLAATGRVTLGEVTGLRARPTDAVRPVSRPVVGRRSTWPRAASRGSGGDRWSVGERSLPWGSATDRRAGQWRALDANRGRCR